MTIVFCNTSKQASVNSYIIIHVFHIIIDMSVDIWSYSKLDTVKLYGTPSLNIQAPSIKIV